MLPLAFLTGDPYIEATLLESVTTELGCFVDDSIDPRLSHLKCCRRGDGFKDGENKRKGDGDSLSCIVLSCTDSEGVDGVGDRIDMDCIA